MRTLYLPRLLAVVAPLLVSSGCQSSSDGSGPSGGSTGSKAGGGAGGSEQGSPDAGETDTQHGHAAAGGDGADAGSLFQGPGGSGSDAGASAGGAGGSTGGAGGSTGGTTGSAGAGSGIAGTSGAAGSGSHNVASPSDPIYAQDTVPRFDITLPQESLDTLNVLDSNGKPSDVYVTGSLTYEGVTIDNIGVRVKGEASRRNLSQKAAFKLKFDEFVDKQEFRGLRRLTFNNMLSDATFMAERLTYQLFQAAELPSPRCNHALVYVNGTFYGVYANVEAEDKTFLSRWFASNEGNLYEDAQVDFKSGLESYFDLETNKTLNDRADLTALISAVETASDATYLDDMSAILDTTQFLRYSALEGFVNQWDGYSYTYFEPNNFRIYNDPTTGKFSFIPWGMDLSWKPHPYSGRVNLPIFDVPIYEDADGGRDSGGVLFVRCLGSDSCRAKHAEAVSEMVALFESTDLSQLAAQYYEQIKEHVQNDTRKEVSYEDFETAYQALLQHLSDRPGNVRDDLMTAGYAAP